MRRSVGVSSSIAPQTAVHTIAIAGTIVAIPTAWATMLIGSPENWLTERDTVVRPITRPRISFGTAIWSMAIIAIMFTE